MNRFFKKIVRKSLRPVNAHYRKKQVAVFHIGRCGSTVLGQMLQSHPDIFWGSELFNISYFKFSREKKYSIVKDIINNNRNRRVTKVYGFETRYLKGQHLSIDKLDIPLNQYIDILKQLGFNYFIILHRKNLLRHAISFQVARKNSKWHIRNEVKKPTEIELSLSQNIHGKNLNLLDSFKKTEQARDTLNKILIDEKLLNLVYEEDIMINPLVAYKKVCSFLNLNNNNPEIRLTRTNPFQITEILKNDNIVLSKLENTSYEWMFYD